MRPVCGLTFAGTNVPSPWVRITPPSMVIVRAFAVPIGPRRLTLTGSYERDIMIHVEETVGAQKH